jgi:hypothetical protein
MEEKTEYTYLRIARDGLTTNFNVIVADRNSGTQSIITLEEAKKLKDSNLLYNKRWGNDFQVDYNCLKEAQLFVDSIAAGWEVLFKQEFVYTIKKVRKKQLTISTAYIREYFPEYL